MKRQLNMLDWNLASTWTPRNSTSSIFHAYGTRTQQVTNKSEQTRAIDLGGDAEERLFIGGEELEMPSPRPLVEFDDPVRSFRRLVLFHRGGFSL